MLNPDATQACWELGSALLCFLNIRAIRKSKKIEGVHWGPTAFFFCWGIYNLWFYSVLNLPLSYWAGLAITIVNAIWLGHVLYYERHKVWATLSRKLRSVSAFVRACVAPLLKTS